MARPGSLPQIFSGWVGGREEAGVLKVREFVYICCARPPTLRQSARRKHQNFTDFNDSKLISNFISFIWCPCSSPTPSPLYLSLWLADKVASLELPLLHIRTSSCLPCLGWLFIHIYLPSLELPEGPPPYIARMFYERAARPCLGCEKAERNSRSLFQCHQGWSSYGVELEAGTLSQLI